jgi:hypothetical protein
MVSWCLLILEYLKRCPLIHYIYLSVLLTVKSSQHNTHTTFHIHTHHTFYLLLRDYLLLREP